MDGKEMDTMKRAILYILLLLPLIAHADHLFEMGVHGGVAGFSTQPVYVNTQVGYNVGAQIYYNYLSPYVIGFRTGFTFDGHNAGFGRQNYQDQYSTIDVENQQMDIDYTIGSLSERYTTWSVGVPLQLALSQKNTLFLVGAKAVFPFATTWKQTLNHTALAVYYPDYENRVEESYPLAASRDFTMTQSGKINLQNVQWWISAELSYIIPLKIASSKSRSYIVVGAYFDYCLSKYTPAQSNAESLVMLTDTRDGFPLQRILTPVIEANRQGRKLVTDYALFDVGVKISYAISPYNSSRRASSSCHCLGDW